MSFHKLRARTVQIARFFPRIPDHRNAIRNAMYLVAGLLVFCWGRTLALGPTLAFRQRFPSPTLFAEACVLANCCTLEARVRATPLGLWWPHG